MDCGSTEDGQLDVCAQPAERRKQECQIDFVSIVRTDTCIEPFGVKPQLRNHTSEDIAALFIAIEAQAGMAVLTEGVLPMLPSTLTVICFSPELAPLLIAAGTPTLRPNPHSEAFLKILLEEINKSSRR